MRKILVISLVAVAVAVAALVVLGGCASPSSSGGTTGTPTTGANAVSVSIASFAFDPQQVDVPVGGTETILLAEDDEAVRVLTKRLLTEFGYKVIEAVDGTDAVCRFRENMDRIDLLLLDLIMPKMNGKEAFDEISKVRPEVKVIFSSGYAPETIRQKAALTDGANLVTKPVSPTELMRKVRNVLDGEQ